MLGVASADPEDLPFVLHTTSKQSYSLHKAASQVGGRQAAIHCYMRWWTRYFAFHSDLPKGCQKPAPADCDSFSSDAFQRIKLVPLPDEAVCRWKSGDPGVFFARWLSSFRTGNRIRVIYRHDASDYPDWCLEFESGRVGCWSRSLCCEEDKRVLRLVNHSCAMMWTSERLWPLEIIKSFWFYKYGHMRTAFSVEAVAVRDHCCKWLTVIGRWLSSRQDENLFVTGL